MKRIAHQKYHHKCYHHLRPGRDTEHERAGDRVMKERLQQIACKSKCPTKQKRRKSSWHADVPENPLVINAFSGNGLQNIHKWDFYRSDTNIQDYKHHGTDSQYQESQYIPHFPVILHRVTPFISAFSSVSCSSNLQHKANALPIIQHETDTSYRPDPSLAASHACHGSDTRSTWTAGTYRLSCTRHSPL